MKETAEKAVQKTERREVAELAADRPVYTPATDIFEKSDSLLVVSDMPGVDEKSVDVTLENDVLTITGHQQAAEPEGYAAVRRGAVPGVFRRSFTLTADIDRARIQARIQNGVLRLELPKAEEAQPRKIAVVAGG